MMDKIQQYIDILNKVETHGFRLFALVFLLIVEATLLVAVFFKVTVGGGLLTAITIIAVLPILVIRVFDISVLNLSKEGIQAEMLRREMNEVLSKVDRLFARTMSEPLYKRLRSLVEEQPVVYQRDANLERQLRYLEDIGYLEFNPSAPLQESGADLRKHITVTDVGKEFLSLRARVPRE